MSPSVAKTTGASWIVCELGYFAYDRLYVCIRMHPCILLTVPMAASPTRPKSEPPPCRQAHVACSVTA